MSKTKLNKYLDRWFDGLGFNAIGRITGVDVFNTETFEERILEATSRWKAMPVRVKLDWYDIIGFSDHQFVSQWGLINSLTSYRKSVIS